MTRRTCPWCQGAENAKATCRYCKGRGYFLSSWGLREAREREQSDLREMNKL